MVENATEAMIRLSAATSFREQDPLAACRRTLDRSRGKSYGELFEEHLREYRSYDQKNRLTLSGSGQGELLPTGERLQRFGKTGEDNGLFALYHRFGRYLLIASSRPGSLPANLQGIWCDQIKPSWDSKYTININTEMNYWPAESCGLSQCHLPLFEHMRRMYPHGQQTAWKMYHAGGWVAHHNTDLWGDTAPQDTYVPATYWVMGAAWLCTHIWEHYLYTLDGDFLAEYYDLMRESCRFFLDVLVQDDKGRLVITPTCSPENTYYCRKTDILPICVKVAPWTARYSMNFLTIPSVPQRCFKRMRRFLSSFPALYSGCQRYRSTMTGGSWNGWNLTGSGNRDTGISPTCLGCIPGIR